MWYDNESSNNMKQAKHRGMFCKRRTQDSRILLDMDVRLAYRVEDLNT